MLSPIHGALDALLELHYSVDIMAEHNLAENLSQYPVVIIPGCHLLPDDLRSALLDYVREGGQLLVVGAETVAIFKDELGVDFDGEPGETGAYVKAGGAMAWSNGVWQEVSPVEAKTVGQRYPNRDTREDGECAASINQFGKGQMGAIYGPLGSVYQRSHCPALRHFLGELMGRLFPAPMIELEAPPCVEVSLRKDDGKVMIHLANMAGMQVSNQYAVVDFIPSVGPLELSVLLDKEPQKVSLVPAESDISWHWSGGKLQVTIPKLDIHGVIVVE
jgi:hypothetical protein